MAARVNTPPFHGTPDNINISAPRSNSNAFRKTILLASHIRNEAHVEGVIRLAGNRNNVNTLSALDDNALFDALNNPTYSVHDKVDLLKKHLREAPILSPTQVDYLAKNIDHMDHAAIANYLKENLSERDFLRLQKLVELFKDVVKAPTSQMTLSNISIVISPTLALLRK
ncbi:MAG: hypothetical protein KDK76_01840 [Chlamydiia bacterium]|nr:hypothetical protein [Chlamydiia bacterium]